jgi:hypothetical protein
LQAAEPADEGFNPLRQIGVGFEARGTLKGKRFTKQALIGGGEVLAFLTRNACQKR